jgi:hypothetical protein
MRSGSVPAAILVGLVVSACGMNSSAPMSPSMSMPASTANVTGSWSGTSADTLGSDRMTWTVTQTGSAMSGTMDVSDTNRNMTGSGTMTGTMNGSTLTFHMSVPAGGFGGQMSSCSMGIDGQGTMSADGRTMTGTYSGSMSGMMSGGMMGQMCGGAMNNGQFTMTR